MGFLAEKIVDIEIESPFVITLPSLFDDGVEVSFIAATMRIRQDGVPICEWEEHDVETALRDLAEEESVDLGPSLHVDRYPAGSGGVHVVAWEGPSEVEKGSLETTEDDFFAAIEVAQSEVAAWRNSR